MCLHYECDCLVPMDGGPDGSWGRASSTPSISALPKAPSSTLFLCASLGLRVARSDKDLTQGLPVVEVVPGGNVSAPGARRARAGHLL